MMLPHYIPAHEQRWKYHMIFVWGYNLLLVSLSTRHVLDLAKEQVIASLLVLYYLILIN